MGNSGQKNVQTRHVFLTACHKAREFCATGTFDIVRSDVSVQRDLHNGEASLPAWQLLLSCYDSSQLISATEQFPVPNRP